MTSQSTDAHHTFASGVAIQMESLSKRYGDFVAVEGLTLRVAAGEVFGLLGPNGAGKTTTMRMLMGLVCATEGSARMAGLDTFAQRAEVMRHVGYLPDEPVFYDYLRGSEIIDFVGEMHGLPRQDIDERTKLLLSGLDLDDAISDYAVNYSRGMKKKLGLMLALLHDPDVLILDEPTNGLDPHATRQVHDIVRERRDRGKTALFQHASARASSETVHVPRHPAQRPPGRRGVRERSHERGAEPRRPVLPGHGEHGSSA